MEDYILWLKKAIERYEEWNNWERTDGLVYHTDCLDDFIDFLERDHADS